MLLRAYSTTNSYLYSAIHIIYIVHCFKETSILVRLTVHKEDCLLTFNHDHVDIYGAD